MSPRPDVSEERKNQILEAALAVFARLGFHESRMDDIASQAGLSKAALYLYYKSKDAIIAALLKHFFVQEFKRVQGLFETNREETVSEQLLLLARQFAEALPWMTQAMPIAFEFYAIAGRNKEVRQFLKAYFQDYRALLTRLIQRGIEHGEFCEVSAEATAIMLAALFEGLALLFFVDPEAIRWADEAETSVRLLLFGLQRPSSS
ncbi:TetR/AcrR family transcriptional regulator [Ktedonospora formicarum]|uniref:TetR family transcriptional regulator n=1 Tax=Ktedonospora formicarum TaxID=2778364 RepID=A0A8J3IBL5_9CHLR|nr:TetR/AcrR family transcriptional regulator [Ktedonospora formicarum]GHO50295.1 TetR family transcriptional regulator [Ktedonospora formicarum]